MYFISLNYNNSKNLSIALDICKINQNFSHPTYIKTKLIKWKSSIFHQKSIKLRLFQLSHMFIFHFPNHLQNQKGTLQRAHRINTSILVYWPKKENYLLRQLKLGFVFFWGVEGGLFNYLFISLFVCLLWAKEVKHSLSICIVSA